MGEGAAQDRVSAPLLVRGRIMVSAPPIANSPLAALLLHPPAPAPALLALPSPHRPPEQIDNHLILPETTALEETSWKEIYGEGGREYLRKKLKKLRGTSLFDLHSVLVQPPQ
eukprot:749813-Hanusia_phi.AAC.3